MKTIKYLLLFSLVALLAGCEDTNPTPPLLHPNLANLYLEPAKDTLFLSMGQSYPLTLRGLYIEEEKITYQHQGVTLVKEYTYVRSDSTNSIVNSQEATWVSSSESIVSVSNGMLKGERGGYSTIYAYVDDIVSNEVVVRVAGNSVAAGMKIDLDDEQIVLEDAASVEGIVQVYPDGTKSHVYYRVNNSRTISPPVNNDGSFVASISNMFDEGTNFIEFVCAKTSGSAYVNRQVFKIKRITNQSSIDALAGKFSSSGSGSFPFDLELVKENNDLFATAGFKYDTDFYGDIDIELAKTKLAKNGKIIYNLRNDVMSEDFKLEGTLVITFNTESRLTIKIDAAVSHRTISGLPLYEINNEFSLTRL